MIRLIKYILLFTFVSIDIVSCDYQSIEETDEYSSSENDNINRFLINKMLESENTAFIDAYIERFRLQNNLKGLSVAIVKDERLIFAKGYGFANEEEKIETNPEHLFRIASVSKLVTAVAVMKLVESGKITLNSPVFGKYGILNEEKFLNIKDKRLENIKVIDLLNHSGGWSQRYGDIAFLPKIVAAEVGEELPINIDSYIKFVISKRLHFEPGSSSVYSNLGYMILGKVVAVASGMSYQKYVQENVLKPAGIRHMQLGGNFENESLPHEVHYYQPEDAQPIESFDGTGRLFPKTYGGNDIKLLGAAGGWIASSIDLMKLLVTIDRNKKVKDILSEKSIDEMTKVDMNGLDPLGWRSTNENGEWWRTGSLPGTSALVKRQPDGFSWVILSNTSTYKGPRLAIEMDRAMTNIITKVKSWPDYNLFTYFKK
jgi:CubicO group peptidase (beta-lactamase class C family)